MGLFRVGNADDIDVCTHRGMCAFAEADCTYITGTNGNTTDGCPL